MSTDLLESDHLIAEVVDHDLGLEPDRVIIALDVVAKLLGGTPGIELGIGLDRLHELVVAIYRHVALENIEDETFVDGLLHRVAVERNVLGVPTVGDWFTEDLQRLVLRSRGERVVAGIGQHLPSFHDAVDGVLCCLVVLRGTHLREGGAHRCSCLAALAGMRFVDQDGEGARSMLTADVLQNERELLHGRDDDLLAALKELAQVELSSNYLNFEKQPAKSLLFVRELNKRFPNNYNFLFAMGNALSDLHRFEEAFDIARKIENNIQTSIPPFVPQLQPRYNQLMGRILFSQGEYDRSMEYFQNALKDTSFYNARVRVWAFVRLGMINDIRKKRKQAEEYYSRALEVEGGEGAAQIEARNYLNNPYVPPAKF